MAVKNNSVGKRRELVKIYEVKTVRDPGGGTDTTEELYWETWAEVTQVKGSRVAETFQDKLKRVFSVKIRWRSDKSLNSAMKVEMSGEKTAIHSIDNVGFRDKYFELITTVE